MITVSGLHIFVGAETYITSIDDKLLERYGRIYAPMSQVYLYRGNQFYRLNSAVDGGYESMLSGYVSAVTYADTSLVLGINTSDGTDFYYQSGVPQPDMFIKAVGNINNFTINELMSDDGMPESWYDIPILAGNSAGGSPVVSRTNPVIPYTSFTRSDAGLPLIRINDLEVAK